MEILLVEVQALLFEKKKDMIALLTRDHAEKCLSLMKRRAEGSAPVYSETFLDLGRTGVICVKGCHRDAQDMVLRQAGWCVADHCETTEATLYFWEERDFRDFHKTVLGLGFELDENDDYLLLAYKDEDGRMTVFAEFEYAGGAIKAWSGKEHYFGAEKMDPESLLRSGHLFVKSLYRILDTPSSAMVHSACVGLGGKGILLCARGGKGKSTLAVSSLLKGFEFVSDDYTILEQDDEGLTASPLYSIITLSPEMYNLMYEEFAPARFVADNARKNKYVFEMSAWKDQVRKRLPLKACLFPEIVPDSQCGVFPCSPSEKGRAITSLVHSTQMQMLDQGNPSNSRKIIRMLQRLDFYKIRLSPDIFGNVECLRDFIRGL